MQVADLVANLSGRDDNFLAMMGLADTRVGALGKSTERSIGSVRGFGLALGALSAGVLVDAIKKATDFQGATQALANNTNMTAAALDTMRQASLRLSTQTGQDATNIAQGYMYIANHAYAGAAAVNILAAATKNAAATNGVASDNANVLAGILKEYNVSATALARNAGLATEYMDVLHNAVANSNFTMQDFVEGGKKAFAQAASFGVPISQVTAQLALMSEHGFPSARNAAQNWSGMLRSLEQPTQKALEGMYKLRAVTGVDLPGDIKKLQQNGAFLPQFLADIQKATGGDFNKVRSIMTQSSYATALEALIRNQAQLKEIQRLTSAAQAGINAPGMTGTNEAFAAQQKTLSGQMKDFSATLNVIAINIGTVLIPALTRVMTALEPFVGRFLAFSQAHPQITAGILGIGTAIGVISAASLVAGPALAVLTGPLGLIAAGAAALYEAWAHDFGGIQEITRSVYAYIQPALQQISYAVQEVVQAFQLGGISAAAPIALAAAQNLIGQLGNWIQGTGLPYLQAHFRGWITAYWQWIQQVYGPLISAAGNLLGQFGAWITGTAAPAIGQQLGTWATAFSAWVGPAVTTFLQQWPGMLNRFLDWIGSAAAPILTKLANWGLQFIAWIAPRLPGIALELLKINGAILLFITETAVTIGNKIIVWAVKMTGWIVAHAIPKLNDAWAKFVDALGSLIKTEGGKLGNLIDKWALAFDKWVGQGMTRLKPQVQKITTDILGWLGDVGHVLYNAGVQLVQGLINGIKSMAGKLASTIKSHVTGLLKDIPGVDLIMHSPSQLAFGFGFNYVQGIINGIRSQHGALGNALHQLTRVVNPPGGTLTLSPALGGRGGVFSGSGPITVTVNSGAITVTNGHGQHDTTSARAIGEALGDFVKQMTQAQRTALSTAPHGQPGVVSRR